MRLRPTPEWDPIFASLAEFKKLWPARGWSWDSRLICITSSIVGELVEPARAALKTGFKAEYTSKTITTAHPYMQEAVEKTGGLRSNQFAFAATEQPVGHMFIFGLWWPWNDQETISLRVGISRLEPNDDPYGRFRDLFNVSF